MTTKQLLLVACLSASSLAMPRLALAQPSAVDKTQTAKEYVAAGLAAQKAGDYDTALTFYGKAYELVPHPVLLFNMAQANRLAGRTVKAIELYRKYLEADPNGPQSKVAKDFIAEYEAQLAAEEAKRKDEAAQREAAIKADHDRKVEEARQLDEARKAEAARKQDEMRKAEEARNADAARKQEAEGQQAEATPTKDDVVDPGRNLRITGIALGAGGVAAIGVGVLFGLHARTLSNALSQPGAVYDPQKVSDGQAANRNMIISTVIGGALIAGGAVTYVIGMKQQSADHVAVVPIVFDKGGGIALGGTLW